MIKNKFLTCITILLLTAACVNAQKIDTTVRMNQEGFRVICNNKDVDNNFVTIQPVKLNLTRGGQLDFPVKGLVTKAAVDDLNDDGEPDLIICVFSGVNNEIGNVIGASYNKTDKSIVPISFPDIYSDPKLRQGYKGQDVYSLIIGTLMRKFPIYLPNDAPGKPTGGIRSVQYKVTPGERGMLAFKMIRTFDTKPEE